MGFIGSGLKRGESVVVIATAEHLKTLDERLQVSNLEAMARSRDRYTTVEVEEPLARFMANQRPDDKLIGDLVTELITPARANSRRVRAFGEMVAPRWARDDQAVTWSYAAFFRPFAFAHLAR